ncbi:transposable element Tcb2 transposase [Trichonephila clavipes]|nr:transposable element Tcb2 transposase [Trichonephila clavipes]
MRSLTSAAEEFGINKSVVSRAWKAFQTIDTAVRKRSRRGFTERDHYNGPGAVVCEDIMLYRWTELHVFDTGSVIGDRYCKEVILQHVHPFGDAVGLDFVFMDDNARPHRTADIQQLLGSEDITRMN